MIARRQAQRAEVAAIAIVPLCSICTTRDATVEEVVDGKRLWLCPSCSTSPVPDPETVERNDADRRRKRVITALRWNPGATFGELRDVLGIPSAGEDRLEYDRYTQTVVRLVRDGVLRSEGGRMDCRYWLVGAKR